MTYSYSPLCFARRLLFSALHAGERIKPREFIRAKTPDLLTPDRTDNASFDVNFFCPVNTKQLRQFFTLLQSPGTCPVKTRSAKYLQVRYLLILLVTLRAVQSVQVYKRLRVGLGHNGARSPFTSSVIAALHCQ
jgi:hypothetical protein